MRAGSLSLFITSAFVISCAHGPQVSQNETHASPLGQASDLPPAEDGVIGHLTESHAIPLAANPFVDTWLEYFQHKGRKHMERYLARSTRYLTLMKQILKENGVPEEMVYVAMIESGFSFQARSRAKAVGYWQFIGGTARRYGLRMNKLVDERRDPIASTQAAAQYLKGLYNLFGQWELALAAYNVGENRVQRVITESYTRDYWEMARRRMLPDETLNYVPKFIAASMIALNPEKYGFKEIDYYAPFEFETVKFDKPISLRAMAQHFNVSYNEFKLMNPAYRTDRAPLNNEGLCVVRVPKNQPQMAQVTTAKFQLANERMVANLDETTPDYFYYRIRRGDNLKKLAVRYGVSQTAIRQLNNLRGSKLRAGVRIKIPGSMSEAAIETPKPVKSERAVTHRRQARVHIVRRGETLLHIAQLYNRPLAHLARANRLASRMKLYVGAKLVIPEN